MCNASLHTHTDASKDGLGTIDRLLQGAKSKNLSSVAMTDHGNLTNAIAFMNIAKRYGIKPIMGIESYLDIGGKRFHLTLLGDGDEGFDTLIKLNNAALIDGSNTLKLSDFERHNSGLVVLSGCPSSPLQKLDLPEALEIGRFFKSILGNRFYSELMFVSSTLKTWERSIVLSERLNIPLVLTNDVHFPYEKDAELQRILTVMKSGYDYDSEMLHFVTQEEMLARVNRLASDYTQYVNVGFDNANKLANALSSPTGIFTNDSQLPLIDNANAKLTQMVYDGMNYRNSHDKTRADYELSVITGMGFSEYFLILKDIIDFSRSQGVTIGPGRGSGVGSYVLYLLGITDIDPIYYNLSFERFLNPQRQDWPDVDIDIDSSSRQIVLNYAHDKYGAHPVATYHTYSHKSLIHDLCRFFGIDKLTDEKLADEVSFESCLVDIEDDYPTFKPAYDAMIDQIRHTGKHAGGVVITSKSVPYQLTTSKEKVVSWTEGKERELSTIGVTKFDFLGLSALDTLSELERKFGKAPQPTECENAAKIIETIFAKNDLLGIFQFSGSAGIVNFVKSVYPTTFEELIAINALYRPGALGAGVANHYIEYKSNPRKIHPKIDEILKETFGIICYQEQFMNLYAFVVGGSLAEADEARKILVKSNPGNPEWESKFEKLKDKFVTGCNALGVNGKSLWDEITPHARYSFNKSHSTAYAMIAWYLAYYKFHYRADFYAAMLNADDDKKRETIYDVIKSGIEIRMPDVNKSSDRYESDGNVIFLPLTAIKFVSDKVSYEIITNRPYTKAEDFDILDRRRFNKRIQENLYQLGAFSGIEGFERFNTSGNKMSIAEAQQELIGFVIPDGSLFEEFDRLVSLSDETKGKVYAGIVIDKVLKQGKRKKYMKYFLFPDGNGYSYTNFNVEIGTPVAFRIRPDGWGNEIVKIKIIGES